MNPNGNRNRTYRIGDLVFLSSRDGARYIQLSVPCFLKRYNAYKAGIIDAEEALRIGPKPRQRFADYGNDEWKALGNKPRPENMTSSPASEFEEKHFPVPPPAEGFHFHFED